MVASCYLHGVGANHVRRQSFLLVSDLCSGEAYLAGGQGNAASAEFQKILDHGGILWNRWTGALGHLGVARASVLQSKTSQGADADAARVRALAAFVWFSSAGSAPPNAASARKVETRDVSQALAHRGGQLRYNQLRAEIMQAAQCSKRTAQLAIAQAAQPGRIRQKNGQYHLPLLRRWTSVEAQTKQCSAPASRPRDRVKGKRAMQVCNPPRDNPVGLIRAGCGQRGISLDGSRAASCTTTPCPMKSLALNRPDLAPADFRRRLGGKWAMS